MRKKLHGKTFFIRQSFYIFSENKNFNFNYVDIVCQTYTLHSSFDYFYISDNDGPNNNFYINH